MIPGFRTVRARSTALRGEGGFTLAEVGIVVAIIAILVSIAVPVLINHSSKAEHAVAVQNLVTGSKQVENVWFSKLATQVSPIPNGTYRDYNPPTELASSVVDGYVPINARYMSIWEPKTRWVDLEVGGGSKPVASPGNGSCRGAGDYAFRITSVWKAGEVVAASPDIANEWELMAGSIGIVENSYSWDGGWHNNKDTRYLTLVTLEVGKGLAHFYTLNLGVTVAGGAFDWKEGSGHPGDSFGDEMASEKPSPAGDKLGTGRPGGGR